METPVQSIRSYHIRQRVSTTNTATVYRAQSQSDPPEVALKAIHPQRANQAEFVRHFAPQIALVSRIDHPHILPIEDSWRDPDGAIVVTRWMWASLNQRAQESDWDLKRIARMLRQVGSALHALHENHLAHGGVKPTNILLDEDENAYLTDFGIIGGSSPYCAPEQTQESGPTPPGDIYCLGVLTRRLLTHTPKKTSTKPLGQIPKVIPETLNAVIATATAESPNARYPDVPTFVQAFHEAAAIPFTPNLPLGDMLTAREHEILSLLGTGLSNADIGARLNLASSTIKWYLKQLFTKLNVHNRVQALNRIRELQLGGTGSTHLSPRVTAGGAVRPLSMPMGNPYKGLRAFQEADAADFFGRERLIEDMTQRLNETHPLSHFMAVVGPSGSGKSSAVKAGLIPALRHDMVPGSARWFITEMLPGTHPLAALELALLRVSTNPSVNLREVFEDNPQGLIRAARLILPEDGHLFLAVDQFEEVFMLAETAEARRFLDLLYAAVTDPSGLVHVVITLRADFFDRPLMIPDFSELLRQRTEAVVPLTALELEQSIAAPAERAGVTIEPRLMAALIHEVAEQPGSLPFLQYTLTELFEQRAGSVVKMEAYQHFGKISGVLGKRADDAFQGLDPTQQAAARQCFLRLVSLGEGVEDTRRRVLISELLSITQDAETLRIILDAFGSARLLTFNRDASSREPTAEVAHEALIYAWGRLRLWLDESRSDIRQQRMLASAAAEWDHAQSDPSYLLSGTRLAQYEEWSSQTDISLTHTERAFLAASTAERERQSRMEAERQARESRLQRRIQQFTRGLAGISTVAAIVGLILTLIAVDRERQARREAAVNRSLLLANAALDGYEGEGAGYGLPLALEAVNLEDPPVAAISALQRMIAGAGTRAILRDAGSVTTRAVAFSSDSRFALSGGCAEPSENGCILGEVLLWDMGTTQQAKRFVGHTREVIGVSFEGDSTTFVSAAQDGSLIVWDTETGEVIRRAEGAVPDFSRFVFNAKGQVGFSASADGALLIWDIGSGSARRLKRDGSTPVRQIALSPDGRYAAFDEGHVIVVWDVGANLQISRLVGHKDNLTALAFRALSEGSYTLISSSPDARTVQWDIQSGRILKEAVFGINIVGLSISLDGRYALMCNNNWLVLFDLVSWGMLERVDERFGSPELTSISPNNRRALIAYTNGTLRLSDLPAPLEVHRFEAEGPLYTVDVSPDGRHLLTGSLSQRTIILWDLETGKEIWRFDTESEAAGARFSPDGRLALMTSSGTLSGTRKRQFSLVDLESRRELHRLESHQFPHRSSAFSPDGRYLLIGTLEWGGAYEGVGGGDLILWDAQTGALVQRFDETRAVMALAFSPDGKLAATTSGEFASLIPSERGYLKIWEIPSGKLVRVYDQWPSLQFPYGVVWDPNGRDLLVGGVDNVGRLNLESGKITQLYGGLKTGITTVDFSRDGRFIAGGDYKEQGNLAVWDAATGKLILHQIAYAAPIWQLVFHPNGRTLFTSSLGDRAVIEWQVADLSLEEMRVWAQANRYLRPFTCEERETFKIEPLCGGH